ncbi:MAG TPA: TIR domain-containing protein [Bryobacteraceae bacterium]|jgi:hypothetical protein|nr:TIR domain-containing protein [Bryobacteraceae bacterium]
MRRVFVGSSTEGHKEADEVCGLLKSEDTAAVYWLRRRFRSDPDGQGAIHGRPVEMPRANVMLVLGLVAGWLGRPNIALCQYGEAELPPDLEGLTVVRMAPFASAEREDCRSVARH